ncbi:MAG TPA: transposase [Ktedonobacteraceae bacterium]|nr:transposase [Ktedonobacteraceae bacterium]
MRQAIHRTAIFTLHHPTRHVRAVLDKALAAYTEAYRLLLRHYASYSPEELRAMATIGIDAEGQLRLNDRHLGDRLRDYAKRFPLEGTLRESLCRDVAGNLLSYLALLEHPHPNGIPGYPTRPRVRDLAPMRQEALDRLASLADNLEEENRLRDLLARADRDSLIPLSFCRIEAERNCGLFYNPETRRFYARLFVCSPTSHLARPVTMAGRYIDIRTQKVYMREQDARDQSGVHSFGSGVTSILVPLEMGLWHETQLRFTSAAFLPQRHQGGDQPIPAKPVSAKLVKDGEAYRLHVSFELPQPAEVKPRTLLGVDRGFNYLAAGVVVSLDTRQAFAEFATSGEELRRLQCQIEANQRQKQRQGKLTRGDKRRARVQSQHVHLCANQIVNLAQKYQAQVVMEDLRAFSATRKQPQKRKKGQRRNPFRAMLPRRQYQKLLAIVEAKLALVGLPKPRLVGSAYTSLTCAQCGHISQENRSKEDRTRFVCVNCGATAHADIQAGVNIARKTLWLVLRKQEAQAGVEKKDRTAWATWVQAYCRGEPLPTRPSKNRMRKQSTSR